MLVAYTNCAGQNFTFSPAKQFNPIEVLDKDCDKVEIRTPLENGAPIRIPARDDKNVCYAIKLVDAVDFPTSSVNQKRDYSVLASDHDSKDPSGSGKNKRVNSHPYDLGQRVVNLFLEGPRSIKLSGAPDGMARIEVDNIILVGVMPTHQLRDPHFYKSYGTSDCQIYNVPGNPLGTYPPYNNADGLFYISFNSSPVQLIPFAVGGTANVDAFRVDGDMETNRGYSLDFRALDCGGKGYSSDIYLSFN